LAVTLGWAPEALAALPAALAAALWSVGYSVSGSVGSGVDRLYYFVFTSSLFSHGLKGTIATTSLVRMF
jgi:hypothetical protein